MTVFFGERWDAPIMDGATWVVTPVGELCTYCAEPIEHGDRGFVRPVMLSADRTATGYTHAECELSGTAGHVAGFCRCSGYPDDRATARLVWRHYFGGTP